MKRSLCRIIGLHRFPKKSSEVPVSPWKTINHRLRFGTISAIPPLCTSVPVIGFLFFSCMYRNPSGKSSLSSSPYALPASKSHIKQTGSNLPAKGIPTGSNRNLPSPHVLATRDNSNTNMLRFQREYSFGSGLHKDGGSVRK